MTNLARFSALSGEQKRLLIIASMLLPLADIALRIFGYRKTQQALVRTTTGQKKMADSQAAHLAQARQVANLVRIAAHKGPYSNTCLRESLVTWWLLQRRDIFTLLKIGIAKENDDFKAHAWVELDGMPVIDSEHTQMTFSSIYHTDMVQTGDHNLQ